MKGEASPALEMSDGPMDQSDPSDKQSYGRTFILPMVKSRNSIDVGSIVLRRQGACQHWKCQMDRSDPSEKPSYGRTFILPMAKLRNLTEGESIALKGEASPALEMSYGPMDRSDPSEKPSYSRTFFLPMAK